MICPKCGQNAEDSGFCPFCGFEFSKENLRSLTETPKVEPDNDICIKVNNSPFSQVGRIERLPYLITKFGLIITYIIAQNCYYKSQGMNSIFYVYVALMLFFIIAGIFAASKRLRDIKWSQWCLLIWLIPVVGIGVGAPLLFIKSKYDK